MDRGATAYRDSGGDARLSTSHDDKSRFEGAVREHSGRVLAALTGQFRDLGLAEDSLQDAWLLAAERWPVDGWPDNPSGWVYTVARRRALDRLDREATRAQRQADAQQIAVGRELDELEHREERWHSGVEDDRLRLIFTCCHPALDVESRVALTLRSVAWLSTDEIASSFGVTTATMAQRLVRAKARLKDRGVPYEVPSGASLPDRLDGVLQVLYLVFNEAYLSARPTAPIRIDLADEAIRLARLLVELMPDEPEAAGLLALMLAQHARFPARLDQAGQLVTLEFQDRSLWNLAESTEAVELLSGAIRRTSLGRYQLHGAIATVHNLAAAWELTDWRQITDLYDLLIRFEPTPVVALNRAVAVAFADGFDAGLGALAEIDDHDRLPQPHLLAMTRGELLLRSGRPSQASVHFERALELATSEVERRHLERRRRACDT